MQITGATVVITGGSRGIGAAMATAFAAAGARVVVAARPSAELDAVAARVMGHAFAVDLTDSAQTEGFIGAVEAAHGPIDILVSNAGLENTAQVAMMDPAEIRAISRLNLEAPMVLTRCVLPGMLARGRGHLVYTSSLAGSASFPAMAPYCATKAGLNNFVASLRLELRDSPVATTLIAPGPVDTQMWTHVETGTASLQSVLKRFNSLHLVPKTSPERLATRVVRAVHDERRHVRHPRRLSAVFWLSEAPRRLNEMILAGVKIDATEPT